MTKILNELNQLKLTLEKHNYHYYVLDNPIISDSEWDDLFRELQKLEKNNPSLINKDSPTQRIGAKPLEGFETAAHRTPMLSLSNAMNNEELSSFNDRIKKLLETKSKIEYMAEPKLDGIGVELIYQNGIFIKGLTRGDGYRGEDITQNLRTINSLPLKLLGSTFPNLLEVRGEVFIKKNDFNILNDHQSEKGLQVFANPRNAAAGSLRQLDAKITSKRPLSINCYEPGIIKGKIYQTHEEFLVDIKSLGLPVNNMIEKVTGTKNIINYHNTLELNRNELDYEIDGTVFKLNKYIEREKAGSRSRSPRWAIAGKFKAQRVTSKIINISVQVGRTGALTPVAKVKPVYVSGVTVTNITLHNQDEINRKDIRIGDNVLIERSGDVIPKIIKVVNRKNEGSPKFQIDSSCPACLHPAVKLEGEAITRCINPDCTAKLKGKIQLFCSKLAMNIEGLGIKIIEQLINSHLIKTIDDIFTIDQQKLSSLEKMGQKSAQNIIESISASKETSFSRFIYALGIRNVGEHTAKILEKKYESNLNDFMECTEEQLINIDEIGEIVAKSIVSFWRKEGNRVSVNNCLSNGVHLIKPKSRLLNHLNKTIFVFTGSLQLMNRNDAKRNVEDAGGEAKNALTKNTTHLVAGKNAGSKIEKAKAMNVTILSEEKFLELLKNG